MQGPSGQKIRGRRGKDSPLWLPLLLSFSLAVSMVAWIVLKDPTPEATADPGAARFAPSTPTPLGGDPTPTRARPRATASPAASFLPPGGIEVNVFNSTDTAGLANKAANQLRDRGFRVADIGNDPKGKKVKGTVEIRFGPAGVAVAKTMAAWIPNAALAQDGRKGSGIDVALGPDFKAVRAKPVAAAPAPSSGVAGSTTD